MDNDTSEYGTRPWIAAEDSYNSQIRLLPQLIQDVIPQLAALPPRPRRTTLLGIGASHAAAATGEYCLRKVGIDAIRSTPAELADLYPTHHTILISQSGRSAELVSIAEKLDPNNLIALTNYAPSPIGDLSKYQINLGNHPDSSVSFLSFTGTLISLGMLADHWSGHLNLSTTQSQTKTALTNVSEHESDLDTIASMIAEANFVDFIGPATYLGAVEEASLMFREGPRMSATGMETRMYLHGPMDAAGPGAHVILGGKREALLAEQLLEQTSNVTFVNIGQEHVPPPSGATFIGLADNNLAPVMHVVQATLLSQYLTLRVSKERSINIDEPVFQRLDTKTTRIRVTP